VHTFEIETRVDRIRENR